MILDLEKLRNEKEGLINDRNEIDSEINRIDRAIEKFEEGIGVLENNNYPGKSKPNISEEIENILIERGALHINEILRILRIKKFQVSKPSISGILQINAKRNKRYKKVKPATYEAIKPKPTAQNTQRTAAVTALGL